MEDSEKLAASSRSEKGAKDLEKVAVKAEGRKSVGQSAISGGRDKSSESEQP